MATTQDLINYYANLLILQYLGKPKAYATIQAVVAPVIMGQLPTQVMNAFELDTAQGVQLDIIGKYVGVTRNVYDFNGPITLDDANFLKFIQIAITENSSNGTLFDIQALLKRFFNGELLVFDHLGMRLSYFYASTANQSLAEALVQEGKLPKPMGVQLGSLIIFDDTENFFGFRTYDAVAFMSNPFNDYDSFQLDWPWLSYDNAVGSEAIHPLIEIELEDSSGVLLQENGSLIYMG